MKQFTSIVLSGGSFWTISTVGALKRLAEEQSLDLVKNYVGTSAGAIICTCLALGFTPQECLDFMIAEFVDKRAIKFDPLDALDVFDTFGLCKGLPLEYFIDRMFEKKNVSSDITFMEFAKQSGKNLVVCVSNVNTAKSEFWCVDNTPGMTVKFALRASCSIPLILTPVRYKGSIYCDGCIYNNLPLSYFKDNLLKDIFAVRVTEFAPYHSANSMMQYIWRIISSMMVTITELNIERFNRDDNIISMYIHCDDVFDISNDTFELEIHKDKVHKLFHAGYEKAHEIILKQKRQNPPLLLPELSLQNS